MRDVPATGGVGTLSYLLADHLGSTVEALDAVGNRSQRVDTTGTEAYTYDALYRLTGVTYPNADAQSYTYDARVGVPLHVPVEPNYSFYNSLRNLRRDAEWAWDIWLHGR